MHPPAYVRSEGQLDLTIPSFMRYSLSQINCVRRLTAKVYGTALYKLKPLCPAQLPYLLGVAQR